MKQKEFNIEYRANIKSSSAQNNIMVWIAIPTTSTYQRIKNWSILPKPTSHYKDEHGNKILHFRFNNFKDITIQINIKAILWKKRIDLRKNICLPVASTKLFNLYISNKKFLEQTSEIKKLTLQITKNKKGGADKLLSVFNFIVNNFKYSYPVKQRGVKYLNPKKLKGDCGESSSLFVTMCRILGVPAKNNTGFVIFPKQKRMVEHGWASVYLKPYGWIDVDPQYASLEKDIEKGIEKYFAHRSDYRIIFTNDFNIFLKPSIPHDFQLNYWNRLGLPLTNKSVQTLQPLVFASAKKIKFNDKIKLK